MVLHKLRFHPDFVAPFPPPCPPFARGGKGTLARDVIPSRATKTRVSKSSLQLCQHQLFTGSLRGFHEIALGRQCLILTIRAARRPGADRYTITGDRPGRAQIQLGCNFKQTSTSRASSHPSRPRAGCLDALSTCANQNGRPHGNFLRGWISNVLSLSGTARSTLVQRQL